MIKTIALFIVAASFAPTHVAISPSADASLSSASVTLQHLMPPAAWAPQDAADSLYRAARDALSKSDWNRSAELFNQIVQKYPSSTYAGESLYYYAFSMYRAGGTEKLKTARQALVRLNANYPDVARRGDATTLRTRVCGELAQAGDAECAAEVSEVASSLDEAGREIARSGRDIARASQQAAQEVARVGRPSRNSANAAAAGCPSGDEDDDERVAALNALLQMDADRAMPILTKVLERRDPCSAVLRRKAVFLISQKHSDKTADLLMNIARNDPDQEVREQAVFWLGQVPDERAVDLLQEILRTSKDEDLQNKALFALSQHSSARGSQILKEFAMREGTSDDLRGQAIFWLGQRNSADNNEFLRTLFANIKGDDLKNKVLFSIAQRKNQGNEKWLMDVAVDSRQSVDVRKQALFWAGQSGVGVGEIIPLYSRINDPEMKQQVIFVLSQSHSPAALDKLIDIAKNDKDPEMRRKAIFWVGQSRDPRAQQLLLDIINK